ncbi:MAG: TolC family protein [Pyrinomonadaceae bacterium]
MSSRFYIFILATLLFCGAVVAQDPPSPVSSPTPFAADKNGTTPDKVNPIPPIAPDYRSTDRSLPELTRVGVDLADQKTLMLSEAILMALENNNDIEVSRKNVLIAELDLKAARGVYEPRFTGQTYYDRSTVPNVSIFSSNQTTTQGTLLGNATLSSYLPNFGTQVAASFNNQRLTTDNPISILSPQLNASLGFSVTQPLFRGRAIDPQRRTIEIAKRNLSLTDSQFRQRSIDIVVAVEKAYWDLAYTLRNLQVQRDAVRDAKEQLEHNRRLVDEGQLAPIDVIAAETQVANYESAVYDALNLVNVAENALKNLISPNRREELWSKAIMPVENVDLDVPRTTIELATDAAIANRPELELNKIQKDINDVDRRYYNSLRKPQIDLIASYNSAGIGGSQNPNFNPTFPTACSQNPTSPACQQQMANLALLTGNPYRGIFRNLYPTYRVGIQFTLPLFGDRTSRAQYGKSLVEGDRLDTQRRALEQTIQVDVRNALQAMRTAESRLRFASISRENSEKQYESERRKLDAGQSDVYRVLDRQTALTAARSNELRAQTELNKTIADLQRATGNSLKANNIAPVVKK